MRIAFLVLAHRLPAQIDRLIGRLPRDAPVFLHLDQRASVQTFGEAVELIGGRKNVRFVRRHRCYWGGAGIVHATLACIEGLVASGCPFDYAMLLSGQDYPIKSAEAMQRFLMQHRDRELIESFRLDEPNRWTSQGGAIQALNRVNHLHLRYRSRILSLPMRRRYPEGMVPHGGSQWWCLSADATRFIHRFVRERPDVLRFFEHVAIPDESFFQTVIAMSPFAARTARDDLTYAIWDRPEPPHPATLVAEDLPQLLASPKLFARKFDISMDARILDLVDRALVEQERATSSLREPE